MTQRPVIHTLSISNKGVRLMWALTWMLLFRPSPRPAHAWRCLLLRLFGAKLGCRVHPYPSAKIWAPWNLVMGDDACLAESVDCYCVDRIVIGARSTISQYSFLCSASHDFRHSGHPLVAAPIVIGSDVWIAADVFVAPGVTIADGVVVTARSSVFDDLPQWTVAGGYPARPIKRREFRNEAGK